MTTIADSTIRELGRDELAAAEPRLAEWLVGEPGQSLLRTYPQIFGPDASDVTALGAFDETGVLRSHAALRRVSLIDSRGAMATTLVGVVATDPNARGSQLASRLMHVVADREIAAGQDAIVLWSDLWAFYAKLGYAVAGVQAEIDFVTDSDGEHATCREARFDDLPTLTRLHAAKAWRIERDESEMRMLVGGTDTDCIVMDRDGEVVAYACHGKGVDLVGWWHEFGGTDEDVAALLPAAMMKLGQDCATILLPPYRNQLFDLLQPGTRAVQEGIVALCKPLTERASSEFFVDGLDSV